ncbi:MAG: hypothetical protein IPJ12_14870 [Betaproteobacteria bacterium]|nr:hypothetical protein [Betaproteobacteria bacterium]
MNFHAAQLKKCLTGLVEALWRYVQNGTGYVHPASLLKDRQPNAAMGVMIPILANIQLICINYIPPDGANHSQRPSST